MLALASLPMRHACIRVAHDSLENTVGEGEREVGLVAVASRARAGLVWDRRTRQAVPLTS
jgi:hypothetical protein